jgi:hypothetical protein
MKKESEDKENELHSLCYTKIMFLLLNDHI